MNAKSVFFLCITLWTFAYGGRAEAQIPLDLNFLWVEAEEALFDGHYDEVTRYCRQIDDWLNVEQNQFLLASRGYNWTLLTGQNNLLLAQAYNSVGDLQGVDREAKRTSRALTSVRTLAMQQGDAATAFWALQVQLENVLAARYRPRRMFLERNAQHQFVRPFQDIPLSGVEAFLENERQSLKKSALAHAESRDIAERHLVQAELSSAGGGSRSSGGSSSAGGRSSGGSGSAGGGGGGEDETALQTAIVLYNFRIEGARQCLRREGIDAFQNHLDAIALLQRASEYEMSIRELAAAGADGTAEEFFPPSAQVPVSFADFATNTATATNADTKAAKRAWSILVREWVSLFMLKSEVEEFLGLSDRGIEAAGGAAGIAERDPIARANSYSKAAGFLVTHFQPDHPLVVDLLRSRVHILMTRLIASTDKILDPGWNGDRREVLDAVARSRDCLLEIWKLRRQDIDQSPNGVGASLVMELRVLEILVRLEKKFTLLTNEQKQECSSRIVAIDKELAEVAAKF
jgi:hypothetical protein